jgi:poly-beta-1,6-N-acetyl-D-glucosamine synthase
MGAKHAQMKGEPPHASRRFYLPVFGKFAISYLLAVAWFGLSVRLSIPWINDLSAYVGAFGAIIMILFIALIPGFLNMFLMFSLLLDKPQALNLDINYPPITILIAAYNEELSLGETFRSLRESDYPGPIEAILIDDGSTDGTLDEARKHGPAGLIVETVEHGGKAKALTAGLARATHDIVLTIDADTFLQHEALRRIIARLLEHPETHAAVAGCVLARNSRDNLMTRMQEWDYFAAINSVKRQQSLYQGTLVAEGAFSAFFKKYLIETGGWPNVIGEDIVLTWDLLKKGYVVAFEPTAVGFTNVPINLKGFYRQRRRWARGMIEGLRLHGWIGKWKRLRLAELFVTIDFVFPFLDTFYTLVFIPGIFLALTGRFFIVGPLTLLVLPITFLILFVMYFKERRIFDELGLKVRKNPLGIFFYAAFYQLIMSPVCVVGYFQEIFGLNKKW